MGLDVFLVSLRSKGHWKSCSIENQPQYYYSMKLTGRNNASSILIVTVTQARSHVPSVGYTVNHLRLYFSIYCMYLATHWCMISSSCLYSWIGSVHILRTELWSLWLIYGNSLSHLGSSVCVGCLLPWCHRNSLLSIFVDVLIKLTFSNKRRCAAVCIHWCCSAGALKAVNDLKKNIYIKVELQHHWVKQKRDTSTFLNSIFYRLQNIHYDNVEYLEYNLQTMSKCLTRQACTNTYRD